MRQFTCPKAVTHPITNRARCRATALIETNALPLHQTANMWVDRRNWVHGSQPFKVTQGHHNLCSSSENIWLQFQLVIHSNYGSVTFKKVKGKASWLDIAPLTILDSGALQPRNWQLTCNDCSIPRHTQWQPRAGANGLLGPQLQPAGILRPIQPR